MCQGFFALTVHAAIHTLRLIHNQDGARVANQVNRAFTTRFLAGAVHLVLGLFAALGFIRLFCGSCCFIPKLVDSTHSDDHDLNIGAGRKVAHLTQAIRVVLKELITLGIRIQTCRFKVLTGDLQGFVDPFFDGH